MRGLTLAFVFVLSVMTADMVNSQVANLPAAEPSKSELAALVERHNPDRSALFRRYDVEYSPERYARFTKFYKDWQKDLERSNMSRSAWTGASTTRCCVRAWTTS